MKKFLLILSIVAGSIGAVNAQEVPVEDPQKTGKADALYVAYITQELKLTPEEAQKFWPVHTQFVNELKAVKKDLPELDKQQAMLNVRKKYQGEFTRILGTGRTEQFHKINVEFKRKLLDRMKKRQNNNNFRPGMKRGQQ